MPHDRPAFKEMTWLRLNEGPGNRVIIHVAPTMKHIYYKGERYFRMDQGRSRLHRGLKCQHFGGAYLWAGWWDQQLAAARRQKQKEAV